MKALIDLKRFSRSVHLYAFVSKDFVASFLKVVDAFIAAFCAFTYRYYRY